MYRRKVDFIIVGQGIAGTWLAHELILREQSVMIINCENPNISSLKAAGLYNPITGRNMVKTWLAETIFSNLERRYQQLEKQIKGTFIYAKPIYRPFLSIKEKNDWQGKMAQSDYRPFIKEIKENPIGYPSIQDNLGGIILQKTGYLNFPTFIKTTRNYFINKEIYRNEMFDYAQLFLDEDKVYYKDLTAKKVLFCEGTASKVNPFWSDIPFRFVRGEIMDIACDMKSSYIINRNVFMIPKNDYFTVGSTYDRSVLSFEPQKEGVQDLKRRLSKLFRGLYRIMDIRAGVRPATYDRKPFIGIHQKFKTLGIFNGFGTKGVSLAPHFASQFADFLLKRSIIEKKVNIERVF